MCSLIGIPLISNADPGISNTVTATMTKLPDIWYTIGVGPGDTLYGYKQGEPRICRSIDNFATYTFEYTKNEAPYLVKPQSIFVTSKGWVIVSPTDCGYADVFKRTLKTHGDTLTIQQRLTFYCDDTNPKATIWRATEDTVGVDRVFFGEYGGAALDHCAYIWMGTWSDTGYVWTTVNDPNTELDGRHIHGMYAKPGLEDPNLIYGLFGDRTAPYTNPDGYIVRSDDGGETWSAISDEGHAVELQYLTMAFTETSIVLATDRGGVGETNFFVTSEDDEEFVLQDSLKSYPVVPWCGSSDSEGRIVVGTVNKSASSAFNKLWASSDGGETWGYVHSLRAYAGADTAEYKGYREITPFTSDGTAFVYVSSPTGNGATYKLTLAQFTDKTDWLIGTGEDCDFETIAEAMADGHVNAGDTLTLKTGQKHRASDVYLLSNMTIQGQSGNADDVIFIPSATTQNVFRITNPGTYTFRDFTCRTIAGSELTKSLINASIEGAIVVCENVNLRNFDGNSTAIGTFIHIDVSEMATYCRVELAGCKIDSCGNKYATGTSSRGPLSLTNVTRLVIDSCEFTNYCLGDAKTAGRAPVYYVQNEETPNEAQESIDIFIRNSLFSNNTSANASTGGAIHLAFACTSDDTDSLLIYRNTFYMNNAATDANGQIYVSGDVTAVTDIRYEGNIFYGNGSDYAVINPPGSRKYSTNKWNCLYLNGDNHIHATTYGDTLNVDPDFVTTDDDSLRKFMPQSCDDGGTGSSCKVTDEVPAGYIGYIEPNVPAEIQAFNLPADEAIDIWPNRTLDWLATSYPDSYAIRYGEAGGEMTRVQTDEDSLTGLSFSFGTEYEWSLAAKDLCGEWSAFSSPRTFTTIDSPMTTLLNPDQVTMTLEWTSVAGADTYAIKFGETCGTGTYVATTETSYEITIDYLETVFWKVRVKKNIYNTWGDWSECARIYWRASKGIFSFSPYGIIWHKWLKP
jgi:hypothetical protein